MMQTRNSRTSYFIIWMFPAPSKPFLQTELGLEDFPCAYSTRPDQMRQISPGAGLTLQCSIRRVCDWSQNTLLQGVTPHKQQEDGLLLESLLTAASWFWFCFSLKDTDLSLFADFWIPTLHVWERKEWEEKQRWLQWFLQKELLFNLFSSARDGSDTGGETAPLLFLIHLSGGLGRHERMKRPTSVLLMLE